MGGSYSKPYTRFALTSLIALAVIGALLAFYSQRRVGADREEANAFAVAGTVGARVVSAIPPAGSEDRQEAIDAAARSFVGGDVRQLRISSEGQALASAGEGVFGEAPPPAGATGTSWVRAAGADGSGYFVITYARDGLTVEIAEDASALDASISEQRLELLVGIAGVIVGAWILLQAAFWFAIRRFRSEHDRLVYLYDTGLQLRESLDVHDVLVRIGRDAVALSGGRFAFIALFDPETAEVTLKAVHDRETNETTTHRRAVDEWYLRRCVATNTTVVSGQGAAGYQQYLGDSEIEKKATLLCVPMSMRDRVVGAIAVIRHSDGKGTGFAPAEVRLVQELAAQAATAVEQALLFSKVRADATTLENSYDSTLKALMAALDAKDDLTEGHCERVAKLTVHLAKMMQVPQNMLLHVERGALLHDVGKIGVPDGILKKPAGLNESEWEAMRKHPLLAGLMVSKIDFLEPALPILLYHHEKFDGSGYPFGLAGDNIPLEARIFSVIDAYDAMTSDRPYRAAMAHDAAMMEIYRNLGTQFDPAVVDQFSELMAARPDLRDIPGKRFGGTHDERDETGHGFDHEHEPAPPLAQPSAQPKPADWDAA